MWLLFKYLGMVVGIATLSYLLFIVCTVINGLYNRVTGWEDMNQLPKWVEDLWSKTDQKKTMTYKGKTFEYKVWSISAFEASYDNHGHGVGNYLVTHAQRRLLKH